MTEAQEVVEDILRNFDYVLDQYEENKRLLSEKLTRASGQLKRVVKNQNSRGYKANAREDLVERYLG